MVAFVQKSTSVGNFGGSNTCTPGAMSAGATAGNLLILPYGHGQQDSASQSQTATGYTATNSATSGTSKVGCFYLVATGGETSATIANSTSGSAAYSYGDAVLAEFSGLAATPYVSADSATNTGSNVTSLAVSSANPLSETSGLAVIVYDANLSLGGKTWPQSGWTSLDTDVNGNATLIAYLIFNSNAQLITSLGTITTPDNIAGALTVFKASSTVYTLSAASGSYSITGETAGFSGGTLTASYGPFAITGNAATLSAYTTLPNLLAACGTYNISFASSSSDFDLVAAAGLFAYTGFAAQLVPVVSPVGLTAAFGSYSIAAQNIVMAAAISLPVASGSYSIVAQNAPLALAIPSSFGNYSIAGQNAAMAGHVVSLAAAFGSYSMAGQNAGLIVPALIDMPNVLGETPAAAFAQLSSLGCTNIDTVSVPSASSNNVIFAQAPNPGTSIIPSYPITLWFYSGGSAAAEAGLAVWGR